MSIAHCLQNAVKAGEISREEAEEIAARYNALRRRRHGSPTAEVDAKGELAALLKAEAAEKTRRVRLAAQAQRRIVAELAKYRTASGQEDVAEAAIALIEHYGSAPYSSTEGRKKAIIGMHHGRMEALLETFRRTKIAGVTPNKPQLENVVREAFGEDSGDAAAKGFAKAWMESAEALRQRFNRAGGAIAKLENWGLPQLHDVRALLAAGKERWKSEIRPRLAVERMRHPATDTPILPEELDAILDDVWRNRVTDGWATREPARRPFGRGALATQRAEHRFLIFRSAEDWLAYQRDYGQGDAFASMMSHLNLMARDIAALEILGPNPNATVEWLKQTITKEGALATAGEKSRIAPGVLRSTKSRAAAKVLTLDAMWTAARGAAEIPVNETAANVSAGLRNWATASVLGSATLSAVPTDPVFGAFARHFAGLPVTRQLRSTTKALRGASRRDAVRAGLILDSAMHTFGTQARYVGTLSGPEWTRWISDRVLTFSGLTPWTQAGRHAFGLEFLALLADHAGTRFPDLPAALRKTFERWGVDHRAWDTMRSAQLHNPFGSGAKFLRPNEVAAVDERLAERMLEMVLAETEYAVPSTTLRGRVAIVNAHARPGTFWGELKRSAAMFKSFAVTFSMLWGARLWRETVASGARGGTYAGALLISTTLGGMLSIWLKDVASGRDPRPVSPKLAFAAMLQGGGLGIFGDFIFADLNRYGGGLAGTATGPMAERVTDFANLTAGNLIQLAAGESTNFVGELRRFASGMIPGSTLWYGKLGFQRIVLDQLEFMADPQANRRWKRRERDWQRNYGAEHWWRAGDVAPSRAPAIAP